MNMKNNRKNFYGIFVLICFVAACGQQNVKKREYEEIVISEPKPMMDHTDPHAFMKGAGGGTPNMDAELPPAAKPAISWESPKGWKETKGSSMRLASFSTGMDDPQNYIECSIVSLGGQAGGLSANVARWMRQINLSVSDSKQLDEFLENSERIKTKSDLPVTMIDFTKLQSSEDEGASSMIAAIIQLTDLTVFLKMTGSKEAVLNNKEEFRVLVNSVKM